MSTIKTFEDLIAWQKGRELTRALYRLTRRAPFSKDYGLRDQICRAAVSVTSNIAEGFERGGNKELIQFLAIAKGSAGEVRAQLHVAYDAGYLTAYEHQQLTKLTLDISNLLNALLKYLKTSEMKGRYRSSKFGVRSSELQE